MEPLLSRELRSQGDETHSTQPFEIPLDLKIESLMHAKMHARWNLPTSPRIPLAVQPRTSISKSGLSLSLAPTSCLVQQRMIFLGYNARLD